jgi:hypothetical protein
MTFDPFKADPPGGGKKRAFLVGDGDGHVHMLVKIALFKGQSINCYHLIRKERRKFEGRNTPNFDQIRDVYMRGIELPYPNDIPEEDVDRWVQFGRSEAESRGLEIRE